MTTTPQAPVNAAFAEATTGVAFVLTLSKRQCNTLLRLKESGGSVSMSEGPARVAIVQVDNLNPLKLRGLVSWAYDANGRPSGFQGLTKAGILVAELLTEAGMTIGNTNTLSVLKRVERSAHA